MHRGQRDLGGAGQVQVVLGHGVDLLLGVGQEPRPVQRLLTHQHRRDHRLEALRHEPLQRPPHQRQLEQHQRPAQVGEARARHAGAALDVHQLAQQLQVVAAGRARLADLAQHRVLVGRIASGGLGRAVIAASRAALDPGQLDLHLLHARGELAHRRRSPRRRRRPRAWPRRSPRSPRCARRGRPPARAAARGGGRPAAATRRTSAGPTAPGQRGPRGSGSPRISLASSTAVALLGSRRADTAGPASSRSCPRRCPGGPGRRSPGGRRPCTSP